MPDDQIYRALNCALITSRTNRTISNKDPITYLRDRAENGHLGESELKRRLKTHLIPYEPLAVGYAGLPDEERRTKIKRDYDEFLHARACVIAKAAQLVGEGETLELHRLFNEAG